VPELLAAAETPIERKLGFSMFCRWPGEFSQAVMTELAEP
jgi:hypothetical protein